MSEALTGLLLASAAGAALWYGVIVVQPVSALRSAVKTWSVAALALAALALGAPAALVLALGLSACGDWALSRAGGWTLPAGMADFGAAHLAYLWLFWGAGGADPALLEGWRLWAALALVLVGGGYAALLWRGGAPMRGAMLGYAALILAMAVSAIALPPGREVALAGALLFVASDALLGSHIFLRRGIGPAREERGLWALYWLAQALLLLAFAGLWPV